jgi:4-oxalocrotonate tautomerase
MGVHGGLFLAVAFMIERIVRQPNPWWPALQFITLPGTTMPTYHVEMLEGRTLEQKKRLVEAITRVSVEVLGGSPESVDVLIVDVKRENWATGGKLWTEPRS